MQAAGTPDRYAEFVRSSKAEIGIAKEGYVTSRCGWFSDRSACYLASGRPVVAQETGFSHHLPTGEGLLAFGSLEEAAACVEEVNRDHTRHADAARAIAEEHLDSDLVLTSLIDRLGASGSSEPMGPGTSPVADEELRDVLERELGGAVDKGTAIKALERRPSPYRTSFALEELGVTLEDGSRLELVFKDAGTRALREEARLAKPELLHDPMREIEVYRGPLADAGLGTATATARRWTAPVAGTGCSSSGCVASD